MPTLTKEQYAQLKQRGLNDETISNLAKQKGYSLPSNKGVLENVGGVVNAVFPGKQVGQAIGTLAGAGLAKLKGTYENYDLSAPTPLQVGGDIAQGALTVASPGVGQGRTIGGRVLANTALGAGLGGSGAVAQGGSASDVVKSTALGGALGGGISVGAETIGALTRSIPKWFAKSALPKLDESNIKYALNKPIGSAQKLLKTSNDTVRNFSDNIDEILGSEKYRTVVGDKMNAFDQLRNSFPQANYTKAKLVSKAKELIPGYAKLVDKVADGTANLFEQNQVRSAIDTATKTVYTSINRPPEIKAIGQGLADVLRSNVKNSAKETVPIFDDFTRELNLNAVLRAINKKNNLRPTFADFAAASAGYYAGGFSGALKALAAERVAGSTGGKLLVAKTVGGLGQTAPVVSAVGKAIKAPLIKNVTQPR